MELEEKVPGGKLVRLTMDGGHKVILSGDFFIYPEEGISVLEETLSNMDGRESLDEIEYDLYKAVKYNDLELVGLDIYAIARLYKGIIDVESNRA
jgi:lipoate-protein ligase A